MIELLVEQGTFKRIFIAENLKPVTHLQLVDDTIVFVDGLLESLNAMKKVSLSFQLLSGLKINFTKSFTEFSIVIGIED